MTENTDKLNDVLVKLAEKFGTTVDHLWVVLLRQARIKVIGDTVMLALLVTLTIAGIKLIRWLYKQSKTSNYDGDGYWMGIILCVIAVVILSILAVVVAAGIVTELLNPEYWALMKVLGR